MSANQKTNEELQSYLENAWLGLGDISKLRFPDAFTTREEDMDHWGMNYVRTMYDPNYLWWTAKTLLGVELLPMQCVIIQEMWARTFPMYLATRGFGKSYLMAVYAMLRMCLTPPASAGGAGVKIVIVGAAFRQAKVIFE